MAYPSLVSCPVCMVDRKILRDVFHPNIDQCRVCGTWFQLAPGPISTYLRQPHPQDAPLTPEQAQTAAPFKFSYVADDLPPARLRDNGNGGDRLFDHRAFIAAYMKQLEFRNKPGYRARAQYWQRLYRAFSNLYEIDLAAILSNDEKGDLNMRRRLSYFRQAVECYIVLRTPFDDILEGTPFEPHMSRLLQLKEETKDASIDLLARIFQDMFGEHQPVFSLDDLRRGGFYGGNEPGLDPDFDL